MDLSDLQEIAEREKASGPPAKVRVCTAAGCLACKSQAVKDRIQDAVIENGLSDRMKVEGTGCMGLCSMGPLVRVEPQGALFGHVSPDNAASILGAVTGSGAPAATTVDTNQPFFSRQVPIVLENSGTIEPDRIEPYIAASGYQALFNALRDMTPAEVVDAIVQSGMRGRGGAGSPTRLKWALVAKTPSERKFVVCNADEGDPGAFMDRSVMESDPHRVLEGMAIAAYAVGAQQGFIYCRGEYPLAISRLQAAIRQARRLGILGSAIFESRFDFKIDIRIGAGAFVCGEETALIASIEGQRGIPRPRPPYPAEHGLFGCPTLINNVETLASIAPIIRKGADWYGSIGTEKSRGTKVFSLAGKVVNTGLIEVPMGTTLRTIVEEMGGGVPGGKPVKAVQTGGPSGGCIPGSMLDTPVDYESLAEIGSIMGSGGMIVMDEADNMVDVARYFMGFCMDESCGKCVPCRAGTPQIHNLLTKVLDGNATHRDLDNLKSLCTMVKRTSLCGLGQSAPNPVLSTLRHFEADYLDLIDRREPAGVGGNGVTAR